MYQCLSLRLERILRVARRTGHTGRIATMAVLRRLRRMRSRHMSVSALLVAAVLLRRRHAIVAGRVVIGGSHGAGRLVRRGSSRLCAMMSSLARAM